MLDRNAEFGYYYMSRDLSYKFEVGEENEFFESDKVMICCNEELLNKIKSGKSRYEDILTMDLECVTLYRDNILEDGHPNKLSLDIKSVPLNSKSINEDQRKLVFIVRRGEGGLESDKEYDNYIPAMQDFIIRLDMLIKWAKEKLEIERPPLYYDVLNKIVSDKLSFIKDRKDIMKLDRYYRELDVWDKDKINEFINFMFGIDLDKSIKLAEEKLSEIKEGKIDFLVENTWDFLNKYFWEKTSNLSD